MSEWDVRAEDYAQAHHVYEHRDVDSNYHGFRMVVEGARWQREQLLTDEAIERAARALVWETTGGGYARPDGQDRDIARRILTAAIEGGQ